MADNIAQTGRGHADTPASSRMVTPTPAGEGVTVKITRSVAGKFQLPFSWASALAGGPTWAAASSVLVSVFEVRSGGRTGAAASSVLVQASKAGCGGWTLIQVQPKWPLRALPSCSP
jgi:hypothetical protein